MRYPEDDVSLADGRAFMVESGPYQDHLSDSIDMKQACCARCLLFSNSLSAFD
jgi:hypothetical protein